jgi:septal ring factor EnvC (AmiA/AmiB activator)
MTLTLLILSVAVAAVFALVATLAARKCGEHTETVRKIASSLSAERGRIATHDAELDQITDTLRKLSGRIGATRKELRENSTSDEGAAANVDRLTWKAQMREKYNLTK